MQVKAVYKKNVIECKTLDDEVDVCGRGYSCCQTELFEYKIFGRDTVCCEVEVDVITNNIKILREISVADLHDMSDVILFVM